MLSRRACLGYGTAALLLPLAHRPASAGAFSFETVKAMAAERAANPFDDSHPPLPNSLAELDYDGYRKIRFMPDGALWHGEGRFSLQFFHLGFLFKRPIAINLVENGEAVPLAYDREMFDFGGNDLGEGLAEVSGFAGFRIHFPLHQPDYDDEIAVFLGASYFRVLGREQIYGISARALAIDTASETGEEFPFFRAFWIERPAADSDHIVINALLDSQSIAGAYRFTITPGTDTVVDVESVVYPRRDVAKLGVAPLTSMYLFGENDRIDVDDIRPEVHDSDGLAIHHANGEWVWRPLVNRDELTVTPIAADPPQGFGLMQRDRDFESYLDVEAEYERRPGLWIEPQGDWGVGRIELVEIPSQREIHDNIVAYWVPDEPVVAGQSLTFNYRLAATLNSRIGQPPGGRVTATRVGKANPWLEEDTGPARQFVIDFAGGDLDLLRPEQQVTGDVTISAGRVEPIVVKAVPEIGCWRAAFIYEPDGAPADLRCFLKLDGEILTETWSYLWTPA